MNPTLSCKQPWAWLIVQGYKPLENRRRNTLFRGEIMIHASKQFDKAGYAWVKEQFPHIPLPEPDQFQMGGIVGKVTITGCADTSDSPWYMGEKAWLLADASPLPFMPCLGALGIWQCDYRSGAA